MTKPSPLKDRFLSKIASKLDDNGCLLWNGYKNPWGYGIILSNGAGSQTLLAHHAALLLIGQDVKKYPWLGVFHTCDTPNCVYTGDENGNDDGVYEVDGKEYPRWGHLWVGTRAANNKDMWNKGRSNWQTQGMPKVRGEDNVTSKLTEALVKRIRNEHKYGGGSVVYIAKLHDLHITTVYRIINRTAWKHVA